MKGIGIFKLPAATTEKRKVWRNEMLNEITKSRVVDLQFREQINNDKVYICEKHFLPEQIEICKYYLF